MERPWLFILEDSEERAAAMTRLLVEAYGPEAFRIFPTAREAIAWLEENSAWLEVISLDHDLGEPGPGKPREDGMQVVQWLVEVALPKARIIIHSANPPAAAAMVKRLEWADFYVRQVFPDFTVAGPDNPWLQLVEEFRAKQSWELRGLTQPPMPPMDPRDVGETPPKGGPIDHRTIDVAGTIREVMTDPYAVYVITMAMADEAAGVPLHPPPLDEGLDLMAWGCEGLEELDIRLAPEDAPPEKLAPFVRLPEEAQQAILRRASYLYLRHFQFKGRHWLRLRFKPSAD